MASLSFIIGIIGNIISILVFASPMYYKLANGIEIQVKSMKLVAIFDVGFLGAVIAVTLLAIHGSLRFTFVGILCAALTIGMYAAPLAVMRIVIKTASVEYMPFFLSFFLFLNAGVWSVYAFLVKDFFVGVSFLIFF
ncbi:bidirectional sugar transporter SWEET16-like [Camellia sinensis]|uniref:bidirectional sugar transporter SWEET16-like n=1 Tax=Camellia sinensis TaxID=4442 RepID=UPI0010365819|nr:bidirectional sugar transporter SWEET16-like [Camellia sinensis]